MFTLTALQLCFTCEAVTPINLNGYSAGSNLRGALGNVMRRAHCPEADHFSARNLHSASSIRQPDPQHAATCPVCWLLAANEHPGEERRGYALVPPRPASLRGALPSDEAIPALPNKIASRSFDSNSQIARVSDQEALATPAPTGRCGVTYAPGQRFAFGLTLFGDAQRFLPYFILAVPEMGRNGVGAPINGGGRGQFVLRSVTAIDPLEGDDQIVLAEGESVVRVPDRTITPERVQQAADRLVPPDRLSVNFVTPLRLIDEERLVKAPDFGVLFKRLLERLDELNQQYGGGERRAPQDVQGLQTLANQVRLIDAQTQWIELHSGSSRSGRTTWLSGFVGSAVYAAPFNAWRALLPWLLWGQITQAGKDVVKGNGVFELVTPHLSVGAGVASPAGAKQSPVVANEIASSHTALLAMTD